MKKEENGCLQNNATNNCRGKFQQLITSVSFGLIEVINGAVF
jgi:hypothetical protein